MHINGEPLSFLRKSQNLSVKKLAQISGVSERTIETIERGEGNPEYTTLCLLSDTFKVPMDILCGRNIDMYHVKNLAPKHLCLFHNPLTFLQVFHTTTFHIHSHENLSEHTP